MKRKPNWLLHGLIGGSLLLHGIVLLHTSDFYQPKSTTYIELTMCDIAPAAIRDIPLPPPTRLANPRLPDLPVPAPPHPKVRVPKPTAKVPVPTDIPANRVKKVHPAKITALPELRTTMAVIEKAPPEGDRAPAVQETIQPPNKSAENRSDEDNGKARQNYLAQVKTRIERHKRYPARARIRQLQGEVTIRFVLTPTGDTQALAISKSSGRGILDNAALKAVRDASPFPRPPDDLFKGEIPLELTIVFKLT